MIAPSETLGIELIKFLKYPQKVKLSNIIYRVIIFLYLILKTLLIYESLIILKSPNF